MLIILTLFACTLQSPRESIRIFLPLRLPSISHGIMECCLNKKQRRGSMGEMDMNTFLVRESVKDSSNLILSVKNGDKCYHFPIKKGSSTGKYEIHGTRKPFSSVQELMNYYMQNGLPESSVGKLVQLILPCTSGIPWPVSP